MGFALQKCNETIKQFVIVRLTYIHKREDNFILEYFNPPRSSTSDALCRSADNCQARSLPRVHPGYSTTASVRFTNGFDARIGLTPSRIWNRWVQDGNTKHHAGSQKPPITSSREDKQVIRMTLMDRAATSRAHQNDCVWIWGHWGERTSAKCIRHSHTGLSSGVIVYVLRPVALPFIRVLQNLTLQQNNVQPPVAGIVQTFLDTVNVRMLSWPARSSNLSPMENIWSMVAEQIARHHTPVTMVDELWHRVEAAGAFTPEHAVQFLFDSIPRRISTFITARSG
ncbi:uncharacterized protein TNCV_4967381 [Trichonephila clavipes]|nr:uncharacterized protein TNCV_4967381 [Trichonephila clavipes]